MNYDSSTVEFIPDSSAFLTDAELKASLFKPCATFVVGKALNDPSNSDPNVTLDRYGFIYGKMGSSFSPTADQFPSGNSLNNTTYLYVAKAVRTDGKVYFTFGKDNCPLDTYYGLSGSVYMRCALSCDGEYAPYVIQSTKTLPASGWHMWNNKSATVGTQNYDALNAMWEWMKKNDGKVVTVYLKVGDQDSSSTFYG